MISGIVLLLAQTSYVPPVWRDLPKRIDVLISRLSIGDNRSSDATHFQTLSTNARSELAIIGKPAIPALIKALGSNDDWTLTHATEALAQMKATEAVPVLLGKLRQRPLTEKHITIAYAIGEFGDHSVVPELLRLLPESTKLGYSEPGELAYSAAHSLALLHDPHAAESLSRLLKREDVAALGPVESTPLGDAIVEDLIRFGPGCREFVRPMLEDASKTVQYRAAYVLGNLGDPAAKPVIFEGVQSEDFRQKYRDLGNLLRHVVTPSDLPFLVRLLQPPYSESAAFQAIAGLSFKAAGAQTLTFLDSNLSETLAYSLRFSDMQYADGLVDRLARQSGKKRLIWVTLLAKQDFPSFRRLMEEEYDKLAWARGVSDLPLEAETNSAITEYLAKFDPEFLIGKGDLRGDYGTKSVLRRNKAAAFRTFLLGQPNVDETDLIFWLWEFGNPADAELFLRHLNDDERIRGEALEGLLRVRGIKPAAS